MSFLEKGNSGVVKTLSVVVLIAAVAAGSYKFGSKSSGAGDVNEEISTWIANNPEKIIESVTNMQKKEMEKRTVDAKENIAKKKNDLISKNSPSITPKGYDVTIIEFFDYNCGYCKKSQATVEELLKEDKKVRLIYKEFPILGAASEELAKVALAVNILDGKKYQSFHNALMTSNARTKEEALKVVKSEGIDVAKIEKILADKKSDIEAQINENRQLGASIGINGTPGFVIGEELVPGAIELSVFKEKIAALRKK